MQRLEIERALTDIGGLGERDRAYVAGLVIGAMLLSEKSTGDTMKKVIELLRKDQSDNIPPDKADKIHEKLQGLSS